LQFKTTHIIITLFEITAFYWDLFFREITEKILSKIPLSIHTAEMPDSAMLYGQE